MNLKEAFRYQNKIQSLMEEALSVLDSDFNVTCVKTTHLRKKVMAEADNECTVDAPLTDYSEHITEMAEFLLYLLDKQSALSQSIRIAKSSLPLDMDGELALNAKRQRIASTFRRMAILRSSEVTVPNGGIGYRFNADGNQVSYRCDIRRVTTINFDRGVIRKRLAELNKKSDDISSELDRCVVNSEVGFAAPFDVNDSFSEVFNTFIGE